MASCSVPGCKGQVVIELTAKPSGVVKHENLRFGFCSSHGPTYADLGYEPAGGAYQAELAPQIVAPYDE